MNRMAISNPCKARHSIAAKMSVTLEKCTRSLPQSFTDVTLNTNEICKANKSVLYSHTIQGRPSGSYRSSSPYALMSLRQSALANTKRLLNEEK